MLDEVPLARQSIPSIHDSSKNASAINLHAANEDNYDQRRVGSPPIRIGTDKLFSRPYSGVFAENTSDVTNIYSNVNSKFNVTSDDQLRTDPNSVNFDKIEGKKEVEAKHPRPNLQDLQLQHNLLKLNSKSPTARNSPKASANNSQERAIEKTACIIYSGEDEVRLGGEN